jgi:hypothetical protein
LNNLTCGIKPEARGVWYAITTSPSASTISRSSSSSSSSSSGSSVFLQATVSSLHDAWTNGESSVMATDASSSSSSSAVVPSWGLNTALFYSESSSASSSSSETCQEDALECVSTSDYALLSQRTSPTSQWFAEPGMTYYLHVTGISGQDTGAFNLQIMVRFRK